MFVDVTVDTSIIMNIIIIEGTFSRVRTRIVYLLDFSTHCCLQLFLLRSSVLRSHNLDHFAFGWAGLCSSQTHFPLFMSQSFFCYGCAIAKMNCTCLCVTDGLDTGGRRTQWLAQGRGCEILLCKLWRGMYFVPCADVRRVESIHTGALFTREQDRLLFDESLGSWNPAPVSEDNVRPSQFSLGGVSVDTVALFGMLGIIYQSGSLSILPPKLYPRLWIPVYCRKNFLNPCHVPAMFVVLNQ